MTRKKEKALPGSSNGKESACNSGDPGSIPGSGRSPGEGHGNLFQCSFLENSTEEPGKLQSMGSQSARHYWVTNTHTFTVTISISLLLLFNHYVMSDSLWPQGLCRPGSPVLHSLPDCAQIHVFWVSDANQLILCCPLLLLPSIFPSIRAFSNEPTLHIRWSKYWGFSFSNNPSREHSGLISFRIDWFDLLTVQGTLKSLLISLITNKIIYFFLFISHFSSELFFHADTTSYSTFLKWFLKFCLY